ncbi:MAG: polysaccharide deacetylase family protein [Lachnospiraceae bacterium]|nr:polysaccharide deacetylase family protein [Lachnospiraceae bacterium]
MNNQGRISTKVSIVVLIVSIVIASGLMIYAVKLLNDKENSGSNPVQVATDNGSQTDGGQNGTVNAQDADSNKGNGENENGNGVAGQNDVTDGNKGGDAADNAENGQNSGNGSAAGNEAGNAGTDGGENNGTADAGSDNTGEGGENAQAADAGKTTDNNDQTDNGNSSDTNKASDLINANAKVSAGTLNVRTDAGTGFARVKIDDEAVELTRDDPLEIIDVKDDWFHVYFVYNGKKGEGYTYGPYVTPNADSGFSRIVSKSDPNNIEVNSVKYKDYDNIWREWWYTKNNDHKLPTPGYANDISQLFPQYGAYYANTAATDADKVMYLTFDCGYENGFTDTILDILKKHNAKACFFVTKGFLQQSPNTAKRMKDEGHLVGNHTANHPSLPKKSDEGVIDELETVEKLFEKTTGYKLDPYMRPPQGDFSERTLKIQQDMGYKTIFWSLALGRDWDNDYQDKFDPLAMFKSGHHSGCIALIHATSSTNCKNLDAILTFLEGEGYRFGTLNEL